jgi:hypothetical protein
MNHCEIINYQKWIFYVENPSANPIRFQNRIEELGKLQYNLSHNKIQYVWSQKENYDIDPLEALRKELTNIIRITGTYIDSNGKCLCDALFKFNVYKINEGQANEQIVVMFGRMKDRIYHGIGGGLLILGTMGAALPTILTYMIGASGSAILYDAGRNTLEFTPRNNVLEGVKRGVWGGLFSLIPKPW